jgi:hypothetical protein
MATLKRIQANRRNALKSTGPRTESGKAVSRFNALKTGIEAQSHVVRGEDPIDLETLTLEYYQRFDPRSPEECFWVDTLIRDDWRLRRLTRADAQIWEYEMQSAYQLEDESALGRIAGAAASTFARLQRRIDCAERSFQRALHELERLQSARPRAAQSEEPPSGGLRIAPVEPIACSPGAAGSQAATGASPLDPHHPVQFQKFPDVWVIAPLQLPQRTEEDDSAFVEEDDPVSDLIH